MDEKMTRDILVDPPPPCFSTVSQVFKLKMKIIFWVLKTNTNTLTQNNKGNYVFILNYKFCIIFQFFSLANSNSKKENSFANMNIITVLFIKIHFIAT